MKLSRLDAVVVGAGPYGLSIAAHLRGCGVSVAIFGKPMELWRRRMPKGMLLRSHWWATSLSDPHAAYGLARYLAESGQRDRYPVARQAFLDYAQWFQERAVPDVDEAYVESIERRQGGFLVTLEDGRRLESATVVMAVGLAYYAHRPREYGELPGLVSHSSDHCDLACFAGRRVVVIGGGQSAIECAALLLEAGARAHVVARRPIRWLARDRGDERSLFERVRAPDASIAPGWMNWGLDHLPYAFQRLPQHLRERAVSAHFTPAASDWLRPRVVGKATLSEGQVVVAMQARSGQVEAALSDGSRLRADHVILATGYEVNLRRLPMLHPSLLAQIETENGSPALDPWFQSSVPGLYFVGLTSLRAFGPLYRFVAGGPATARRVARSVARSVTRKHRPALSCAVRTDSRAPVALS